MTEVEYNRREIYQKLTLEERKIVLALAIKKAISKVLTVNDVAKMFLAQRGEQCSYSRELNESIRNFKIFLP